MMLRIFREVSCSFSRRVTWSNQGVDDSGLWNHNEIWDRSGRNQQFIENQGLEERGWLRLVREKLNALSWEAQQ